MSELVNTCPACGAEESLDALLCRMLDDDTVRRLIADVVTQSLPLGALLVRYLRLHKPAKQRLRMATVAKVLGEIVPDIQRSTIERNGRLWAVGPDAWRHAFQACFDAHERGTLTTPLQGNGYLYQVLMRGADRQEAAAEEATEQSRRHRAHVSAGPTSITDLVAPAQPAIRPTPAPAPAGPRVESPLVRRMKAQMAAGRAAQEAQGDQP